MKLTLAEAKKMMERNGGNLDLRWTGITSLPEGLIVFGWLDLRGTGITSLPKGLIVVDWLDLRWTKITSLPEGLTVGDSFELYGTGIEQANVKWLHDGDYVAGKYLYAGGILTHVKSKKQIKGYTYYVGKIPGKNVVYDGKNYARCKNLREGISDLLFKSAVDRGAGQYKGISLDKLIPIDEMRTMYRVITGACQQGTQAFIDSLRDKLKEAYTIREVISLTEGQYGADKFKMFFDD